MFFISLPRRLWQEPWLHSLWKHYFILSENLFLGKSLLELSQPNPEALRVGFLKGRGRDAAKLVSPWLAAGLVFVRFVHLSLTFLGCERKMSLATSRAAADTMRLRKRRHVRSCVPLSTCPPTDSDGLLQCAKRHARQWRQNRGKGKEWPVLLRNLVGERNTNKRLVKGKAAWQRGSGPEDLSSNLASTPWACQDLGKLLNFSQPPGSS